MRRDLDGAILVLEDVSDERLSHRPDVDAAHLRVRSMRVAGLAFGGFTDIPDDASDAERPLDACCGKSPSASVFHW